MNALAAEVKTINLSLIIDHLELVGKWLKEMSCCYQIRGLDMMLLNNPHTLYQLVEVWVVWLREDAIKKRWC
jgi:hypothetical protein